MDSKKNYLTKEGYEKLVAELNELRNIKLPEVLERLAEAKAMGDLSENFEYKSALEDKDFINTRMAEIETLIENVEIIKSEGQKSSSKVVDYGSRVVVELDDEKKQFEVVIVGTGETAIEEQNDKDILMISLESPLGIAIKGKKAGEIAKMRISNNRKSVKIISVK